MHELQEATSQDQHLNHLMDYLMQGDSLKAKPIYHKTSAHTGHSETIWQLLMGWLSKEDYSIMRNLTTAGTKTATYQSHGHQKKKKKL